MCLITPCSIAAGVKCDTYICSKKYFNPARHEKYCTKFTRDNSMAYVAVNSDSCLSGCEAMKVSSSRP